ncbi:MAG: hypothetical protein R6V19_14275 [Armatimonadota bacterium]
MAKNQADEIFFNRQSVTDSRVTLKDEQLAVVGSDVVVAFGPRRSIYIFSPEDWQIYRRSIEQAASENLHEFERQMVIRQLLQTAVRTSVDSQKRLRIPQPHLSRAGLVATEHPEVDVLYMPSSDGYERLEMWPADGLSEPEQHDEPYNEAYSLLIRAARGETGVGPDVA